MTQPPPPFANSELDETDAAEADVGVDQWRNIPRRTLTIALSVLPIVALANVGVLIWALDGIDLAESIVAPGLLGLVALLVFVPMIGNSIRLALWARFLGLDIGFLGSLKVITGTMVTNSVTPSATGGAPIKLLFLIGEGVESRRALTLISFQAAEDTLATLALLALCLTCTGFAMFDFLSGDPAMLDELSQTIHSVSIIAVWSLLAIVVLGFLVAGGLLGTRVRSWFGKAFGKLRSFFNQIVGDWQVAFKRGKWIAAINLGLALLQWGIRFSIAGLVLAAFGVEWQPAVFWMLQYFVQSISALIPTPGGAGGAEAGFLLLFRPFVSVETLFPAMSTWRLMFFYLPLIGAAFIFFLLHRRSRARAAAKARDGESSVPAPAE